jgi:hypothetical protein
MATMPKDQISQRTSYSPSSLVSHKITCKTQHQPTLSI